MTFENSEVSGVAVTFSRDLNIGTLKAIVSQRITDWADNLDLDGSPFPVANTSRFTKYQADSVELQLVGSRGDMNYVFGYYELDEEAYTSNPQNFSVAVLQLHKTIQATVYLKLYMDKLNFHYHKIGT